MTNSVMRIMTSKRPWKNPMTGLARSGSMRVRKNPNRMLKNTSPRSLLPTAASTMLGGTMPRSVSTSVPVPLLTLAATSSVVASSASNSRAGTPSMIPGRTMLMKESATTTATRVVTT